MKKDKLNITYYATIIALIGVVALFVISVIFTPTWTNQYEQYYTNQVEQKIYKTIKQTPESELEQALKELKKTNPFEVAIYKDNSDKIIYRSLPGTDITTLKGLFDERIVSLEVQGKMDTNYNQTYRVWYTIYRLPKDQYIHNLMMLNLGFLAIAFLILLFVVYILQKQTIKPLQQVKRAIAKLSNYNFSGVTQEVANDAINEDVQKFALSLQSSIKAVSRNHSQLEQALQLERERLSNVIIMTRGLVHDLKTPVHQNILANELKIENKTATKQTKEIAELNIQSAETLIFQINNILTLLDSDVQEMMEVTDDFDATRMYQKVKGIFLPELTKRQLIINGELPETLPVKLNKVATYLIIHNLLSNAIKYALKASDIDFEMYVQDGFLYIICQNITQERDIERIKNSEELFHAVLDKSAEDERYIYSTGNGLYLIKELTKLLQGAYDLHVDGTHITIQVALQLNEEATDNE